MDIISQKALELVPFMNYPNFKEILEELVTSDPSINTFLLNMELKRLCSPCVRIIDFRRDGQCEEFEYSGIHHFLLPDDLDDFKQQLELYHGVYSTGLYEELMRNHSERKRIKQEEVSNKPNIEGNTPNRFSAECIKFASYSHRRDERMFYCSPIIITFPNGRQVEAKTSDLSCSGIKILLPFVMPFTGREKITITFTGLIELFPKLSTMLTGVLYETLGVDTKDTRAWLKTRYLADNKEFENFILSFQENNRYRYRIDTDYFAYTLNIKAMEYEYLPKVKGITIFFSEKNDVLEPRFLLKSNCNHDDLDYWRDERSDDKLRALFTNERIHNILNNLGDKHSTTIYSFKHTSQNHIYFLCATSEELAQSNLTGTFLRMSATHSSFKVFKFEIAAIDHSANSIKNIIADTNCHGEEEILTKNITDLSYVGILTRIDLPEDVEIYSQFESQGSANALQRFTLITDDIKPINIEYLQYTKPRVEQRFNYKTPVVVYSNDLPSTMGWTRDLSPRGLQIELATPVECYNNDVIYVSLPKLQELSNKTVLENVPYDVIFVNSAHTILHLRLHSRISNEPISQFLEELFKANTRILEPAKVTPQMSNLSKALRSMTISNLFSTPIIFKRGCVNRLGFICQSKNGEEINKLFELYPHTPNKRNVFPLLSNSLLKNHILPGFQVIKNTEKQLQVNIYVRKTEESGEKSYLPQAESDFENSNDKLKFIKEGFQNGYFGAFAVFLSITGRPNIIEISHELEYLKRAAIHKFKTVENSIWSTIGFADIIDITESTLIKNGIQNQLPPSIPDEHVEF